MERIAAATDLEQTASIRRLGSNPKAAEKLLSRLECGRYSSGLFLYPTTPLRKLASNGERFRNPIPDRAGYLWLKSLGADAIHLRTADLIMPHAGELESAVESIRRDKTVGWRLSLKDYEQKIAERERHWNSGSGDLDNDLAAAYARGRGAV